LQNCACSRWVTPGLVALRFGFMQHADVYSVSLVSSSANAQVCMVTMDGWKKGSANRGTPLVNVIAPAPPLATRCVGAPHQ
jgi:hypothetical protein